MRAYSYKVAGVNILALFITIGCPRVVVATTTEEQPSEPTASANAIAPPKPIRSHVEAPVEPEQPVQVLLELVVTEAGLVDDAKVLSGNEPFASAALKQSTQFLFEPATVRGKPVASKIRFLVKFEPKVILEEPTNVTEPTQRAPVAAPSHTNRSSTPQNAVATTEVLVVGVRPAYTTGIITRAEAREVPGTFGDPLRALETAPGVTPLYSGVPFFFVRGAPPGNIGIFLDGIRLPLLYHAVMGPSVIHPGLIDHVDIFRGAPSAQFGRYAGAIINAGTRPGLSRLGGEANIRLFDAGGLVETPFASGKGHVLVGGRYSYTALAASLLSNANLQYWDYQTRVDLSVGKHGRLGVFAFGAYDRASVQGGELEKNSSNASAVGGGLQFHRVDMRYDFDNEKTKSRLAATVGFDQTDSTSGALRDRLIGFRSLTQHRFTRDISVNVGGDLMLDAYRLRIDETSAEASDIKSLFPARTDVTFGAFTELNLNVKDWATIAPGIRADGYRVAHKTASSFDPRMAVVFKPTRHIYATYSVGMMHQAPNFVPQIPAAQVGTLEGGLQRLVTASSTIGAKLPWDLTAAATGFRSAFYHLLDPIGRDNDSSFDPQNLKKRERGSAMGVELELRRAMTRRIGGFVSCTLSRTERSSGARESLSAFDRPVILQAALGIDLGRNFRAGARLAYYSGVPAQVIAYPRGTYFDGSKRADAFFRSDLRLERRWIIPGRGYWAVVAEMLNATMSREVISRKCSQTICTSEVTGPVAIPSIGVELYSY